MHGQHCNETCVQIQTNEHVPTLAFKNLDPNLLSVPMAWATSETSAPVASHTADIALILDILWAKKAFAA